jgi:hypothetical protein
LVLIVSEVESLVFNQAHTVPSGVKLGSAGGLGITFLTDAGKKLKLARKGPLYTAEMIGGVAGRPLSAE